MKEAVEVALVVAMLVVTSGWAIVVHVNKMQRQDSHHQILGTMATVISQCAFSCIHLVQELCESRGGRSGLSVLTSLLVSVDVKIY